MIRGLYTSVSGLAAADRRQQTLASNIANAGTTGFKADDVTAESFDLLFNALVNPDPATPGTGVVTSGRRFDLGQGGLTATGAPLDAALDGPGFFVLSGPAGTDLYTRTGSFTRDEQGVLRSQDGTAVQGIDGRPIVARGIDIRIAEDGTVTGDGQPAGRLRIVAVEPDSLARAGTTTFTGTAAALPVLPRVVSGAVENSNVDVTAVMTTMTMLMRAFEASRQAIQLQNDTLGQTVNQVGRIAP